MTGARLDRVGSAEGDAGLRGLITRLQWRRRGAWLRPMFVLLTLAYAIVGHLLPPLGDSQSVVAAALLAGVLNLVALVLLTLPLDALLRRARPDLPTVVTRDLTGRVVICGVFAALLIAGLAHRPTIVGHQRAMRDALARAQAWIGDRAPAQFRRNVRVLNTFAIQPGQIYRVCVPDVRGIRSFCVVVKLNLPFQRSVSFAGYEPNSVFAEGTQ